MRLAVRLGVGTAVVAAALNAAVLSAPAAHADASVQVFQQGFEISNFPAALPLQGSCVNGGSGEVILINGTLHFVAVVTTDAAGGMHVALNQNFSDVTGVGTVSGDTYRVTD